MLEQLRVLNLGCLDERADPVSFSRETVLIGPNNSGKSTLIAGLNLLRSVILQRGRLTLSTSLHHFQNWTEAVHNQDDGRIVSVFATIDSNIYHLELANGNIKKIDSSARPWNHQKNVTQIKSIWYFRPNRSLIPYTVGIGGAREPLQPQISPSGHDIIQFLLERYTGRDPKWQVVEEWFKRIDPELLSIRTPIRGQNIFFENVVSDLTINASYQGSGFQSVASVISAVVFSPRDSTIIIEEPEICLHKRSQEALVDLFNHAVKEERKQIIFTTHSWDMLLPFISDVGRGTKRGRQHVHADPDEFTLLTFDKSTGRVRIAPLDLGSMKVSDVKKHLKVLWG